MTEKFKYVVPHNYHMANMTLHVPDELLVKMKHFKEMRWSEVARQAIEKRISDFEIMEKILSKSKLTEKDAKEIAEKIDASSVLDNKDHASSITKSFLSKSFFIFM